jgi:hypothetical protein
MFKKLEARLLQKVLDNPKAKAELLKRARAMTGKKGAIGDGTLLQLLIENGPAFIALLRELIKLFSL